MNHIDQISENLLRDLDDCAQCDEPYAGIEWDKPEALRIIKAAIEKATVGVWNRGYNSGLEAAAERAAQESGIRHEMKGSNDLQ